MNEREKDTPADSAAHAFPGPEAHPGRGLAATVAIDRQGIKARLRTRLAEAAAESSLAKILVENFKAEWRWLEIEDGQPVELQQLAPKAPDEDFATSLRERNRREATTGEYRLLAIA